MEEYLLDGLTYINFLWPEAIMWENTADEDIQFMHWKALLKTEVW